jgi:hypothetical protein
MPASTSFNHETLQLDGETFADCEFKHCRLVYSGGQPPSFTDCRFDDCEWKFEGAAALTLEHLKVVWGAGGKAVVQGVIKEITGGGGR